jgi:beta-glucosidase/6-phospho-beta-glucosidase/beta-galactosidase
LGLAGKLPKFICPAECWDEEGRPKLDFIGLDYYYGIRSLRPDLIIGLLNAGFKGDFNEAPIWPKALHDSLNYLSKLINDPKVLNGRPPMPLYILENGWVDVRKKPMDRVAYIQEHIKQVQRAKVAGLDVKMYIYWSLTTNSEWGQTIGPNTDFGLFHIDLKEKPGNKNYQKRIPAEDGICKLYEDIIHNREVRQK